jgi:hypothetical protein
MLEITVIAAAVTVPAVGYYVIGGDRGTPGEITDNPEQLTGRCCVAPTQGRLKA